MDSGTATGDTDEDRFDFSQIDANVNVAGNQAFTFIGSFDSRGDRLKAQYFVLTVASDNPEKWGDNKIVKQLTIAPPAVK